MNIDDQGRRSPVNGPVISITTCSGPIATLSEFVGYAEQVLLRVFARSLHIGARVSNARWGAFGGCAAEEVEFRAEGSKERGKSPAQSLQDRTPSTTVLRQSVKKLDHFDRL
jgi:hypothetical protein